jgi:autotransporter-associated beta strand protein
MNRSPKLSRRLAAIGIIASAAIPLLPSPAAAQYTWTGAFDSTWNNGLNWSGGGIPNSATATATFGGQGLGTVNIAASQSAQSLLFSNPTGSYTLTSSPGQILSGVTSITVAAGVTGLQTINLANISTGSLLFPSGSNLTITNNSTTAGTTLEIGPNTVIGTPGFGGVVVTGVGTTQISGALGAPSPYNIVGGLTMNGTGTLILANSANIYTGGTIVNAGTLMLGSGTAIPAGGNVIVASGATFNTGGLSNGISIGSSTNAIGAITLTGGTFRVPSGSGDYWLNQLVMTGGTVDFTGTSNFWLHFTNAGAAITTNASPTTATWIGAGTSHIQNDTAGPISITVNPGSTP